MINLVVNSSSGREVFTLSASSIETTGDDNVVRCALTKQFWAREKSHKTQNLVEDFRIFLNQVVISRKKLFRLKANLQSWLENHQPFNSNLCNIGTSDPKLSLAIGPVRSLICSTDKPAFIIKYHDGASMSGTWAFIIDQSCVRLAIDSLDESQI